MTVDAGTEGVELVVHRGASLAIMVAGWPEGRQGTCRVAAADSREDERITDMGKDGAVKLHGLDAHRDYVVWITLQGDDRFAYATSLRPGDDVVRLQLSTGDPIHVRVHSPEGVMARSVRGGDGVVRRYGRPLPAPTPRTERRAVPDCPLATGDMDCLRWGGTRGASPVPSRSPRITHHASGRAAPGDTITLTLAE